ncbi:MAG TPA: hypothetical protein VJL59_20485 [Anaerolineales bacterium]|nr:hypothetical protein [Anaerolineales bacterium]
MSNDTLSRELRISREVDGSLNSILADMQKLMDDTRIHESGMEVHQMANLVAVAQETDSVEVVKHYIRYQLGRDSQNKTWRWRLGSGKNFGEQLVDRLDGLRDRAQLIVSEAKGDRPAEDRTWMTLTRLYIGHMRRYFVYRKKS